MFLMFVSTFFNINLHAYSSNFQGHSENGIEFKNNSENLSDRWKSGFNTVFVITIVAWTFLRKTI